MKCPFRTTKTITNHFVDNVFSATHGKVESVTENTEFEECLENDCPCYNIKTKVGLKQNGDLHAVKQPICRKVENNGK